MKSSLLLGLPLFLAPLAQADAVHALPPAVAASIHDEPVDGVGDSFNTSFTGLIRTQSTRADRAIHEYDVSVVSGETALAMAEFSGTVFVNNAADNGVRTFDFLVYDANGVAELSDYSVSAIVVGSGSYHPPMDSSFNYTIDATSAVEALVANGATHIGLRVQGTSSPNFPNILDATNALLAIKVGSLIAPNTFCFGDGSGTACPCGNAGGLGRGCSNSFDALGAQLSGVGSASVSGDDLVLSADGLVPNVPGLYFQADNAVNGGSGILFGDGLRCAGGNVVRLEVAVADANGASSTTIGIATNGGVSAGEVKRYQCWYRDPVGSPCGSGFNLSNGFEVNWVL
jgi:hypothetical protein